MKWPDSLRAFTVTDKKVTLIKKDFYVENGF